MTNAEAIVALKQMKTFCAAGSLDQLEYAIEVLEVLDEVGITNPLDKSVYKDVKK
ncbi:MAG: hypothetical protein MJ178_09205 [Treponemataceae bacterium]|nr:hypothetical protein [Treponemataceae bacterium]